MTTKSFCRKFAVSVFFSFVFVFCHVQLYSDIGFIQFIGYAVAQTGAACLAGAVWFDR